MTSLNNRREHPVDSAGTHVVHGELPTSAPLNVAIIDGDTGFVESLSANLHDHGFAVQQFAGNARALRHHVDGPGCDAILIDWHMLWLHGAAFLKAIRDAAFRTPVVVMTANGNESDEETALDLGAVDFIDKTCRVSILAKRLNLIVGGERRQAKLPKPAELIVGDLSLRMNSARATWYGQEVCLTFGEFHITKLLASRGGTDVSYREIYDVVHGKGFCAGGGDTGYRVNVRSFIRRIREKFQRIDSSFDEIANYPGFGYRWRTAMLPLSDEETALDLGAVDFIDKTRRVSILAKRLNLIVGGERR